jgi:A/G-specific adenine glycosylase
MSDAILMYMAPRLLTWYDMNARDLPWRESVTPYRVWVAEMMLQQTQVETVKPYYVRFLAALPDVEALAAVDEAVLMKLWEGLGYYRRARALKRAAQTIVSERGGIFPLTYADWLQLPGIGAYTAGAITSIAYNLPVPAVDGNALRVLSRLLNRDDDVTQASVRREFARLLQQAIDPERPGQFNQAVMDLGAGICRKSLPRCPVCPLMDLCEAYRRGRASYLPYKTPRRERLTLRRTVWLIRHDRQVLLHKRADEGMLAGLWELPNADNWYTLEEAGVYLAQWPLRVTALQALPDAKHVFTHQEWHMKGYAVQTADQSRPEGDYVWAVASEIKQDYPIPRAFAAYMRSGGFA